MPEAAPNWMPWIHTGVSVGGVVLALVVHAFKIGGKFSKFEGDITGRIDVMETRLAEKFISQAAADEHCRTDRHRTRDEMQVMRGELIEHGQEIASLRTLVRMESAAKTEQLPRRK